MTPEVTIVGSGTLVPSGERSSPAHLVEYGATRILLDAGPGTVHGLARHGLAWWKITHVVFTHYHTDHFGDLPHLLFAMKWAAPAPRSRCLRILGPSGLTERVEALRRAHGNFIVRPGFELDYEEVARSGVWRGPDESPTLRFHPVPHTDSSVAVRVEMGDRAIGYTGDTGRDRTLGPFLRGVDVLISECAHPDPAPPGRHLSPASVAEMAQRARPGVLVLTHMYPPLDAGSAPSLVRAAGYRGRVVCADDGERFVLE